MKTQVNTTNHLMKTGSLKQRILARSRNPAWQLGAVAALLVQSNAWAMLPIEHWQQPDGAKIWLVQSNALPMVDVRISFDAGERRAPAAQAGLASATAEMLTKGTKASGQQTALDENQLDDAWADLGARFSASANDDAMQFSLRSLTQPDLLNGSITLAARQIGHPAWPADVWKRERQRWASSLEEARTRPATLASEAFSKAVYGTHPYGYQVTAQTLQKITANDMKDFYSQYIKRCNAYVTVVGAVSRAETDHLVQNLLAELPANGQCQPAPALAEIEPLTKASETTINVPSEQTTILVGQPGIKRDDPDFFAMLVGNHILGGGGFTSRLMHEVREKRGLVYGVNSDFAPGRHAGAFSISLQTRNNQAHDALELVRQVVADFVAQGPTEEELQAAKDFLIGGFALRIDSNSKLLGNVSNIAWNNLPLDYLDHWTDKVAALNTDDIRQAIQRHLDPQKMATVIVGNPSPRTATANKAINQ